MTVLKKGTEQTFKLIIYKGRKTISDHIGKKKKKKHATYVEFHRNLTR